MGMGRRAGAIVGVVVAALVGAAACVQRAGARWDPALRRACSDRACFRVGALPPDWRLVDAEEGAFGFFSDRAGAVIEAKVTCRDDAEAAPLSSLLNQLLIGYTDRRVRFAAREPMAGREALHAVIDLRLDGVPMVLDLYVLRRDGCVFDLSCAAPPDRFAGARAAFAAFVAGFTDEGRRS